MCVLIYYISISIVGAPVSGQQRPLAYRLWEVDFWFLLTSYVQNTFLRFFTICDLFQASSKGIKTLGETESVAHSTPFSKANLVLVSLSSNMHTIM